ncbi:sigma factor G inhibitor Gin [Effusibacillus pohliae]|uniref:sigma factor G inhibitor Gin n=1 Tax=Effusibacillus pohliae TaxID=232270 RepID=UPI00037E4305|nr:sigma factor G inhibitor Gin [Effusibacillus pohliae]
MSENPQSNVCIVCREQKPQGIRIWGQFVCLSCERDIVQTDVEDEKYPFYIERMKQIWLDMIS